MGDISKNFSMSEFSASTTADARKINNEIPATARVAVRSLVLNLLQPVCDVTGWRCRINSGYRCPELNKAVGGVPTSQHTQGEAADCVFIGATPIQVLRAVTRSGADFDQMIAYPGFVHLSYTTRWKNRRQVLYNSSYKGEKL